MTHQELYELGAYAAVFVAFLLGFFVGHNTCRVRADRLFRQAVGQLTRPIFYKERAQETNFKIREEQFSDEFQNGVREGLAHAACKIIAEQDKL